MLLFIIFKCAPAIFQRSIFFFGLLRINSLFNRFRPTCVRAAAINVALLVLLGPVISRHIVSALLVKYHFLQLLLLPLDNERPIHAHRSLNLHVSHGPAVAFANLKVFP